MQGLHGDSGAVDARERMECGDNDAPLHFMPHIEPQVDNLIQKRDGHGLHGDDGPLWVEP
jgi:hypothetical protein